jgi:hypothetical protein
MSGSDYVQTPNLSLFKPTVDADEDMWGTHTNQNWDTLDTVLSTSVGGLFLPLTGGALSGQLALNAGAPVTPFDAANKSYVDAAVAAVAIPPASPGGAVTDVVPPGSPLDGALWWDATSGNLFVFYDDGTSTQWVPATSTVAMPAPRNEARLQSQWVNASTVSDDTVWWWDMPYAGTVSTLKYFTGNGSFNVAIKVNGTTVTGLGAVAVSSSTPATATATAANTFSAGDNITAVITGSTGAPTDALLSLAVTWS